MNWDQSEIQTPETNTKEENAMSEIQGDISSDFQNSNFNASIIETNEKISKVSSNSQNLDVATIKENNLISKTKKGKYDTSYESTDDIAEENVMKMTENKIKLDTIAKKYQKPVPKVNIEVFDNQKDGVDISSDFQSPDNIDKDTGTSKNLKEMGNVSINFQKIDDNAIEDANISKKQRDRDKISSNFENPGINDEEDTLGSKKQKENDKHLSNFQNSDHINKEDSAMSEHQMERGNFENPNKITEEDGLVAENQVVMDVSSDNLNPDINKEDTIMCETQTESENVSRDFQNSNHITKEDSAMSENQIDSGTNYLHI